MLNIDDRVHAQNTKFSDLQDQRKHLETEIETAEFKMQQILKEQDLIERTLLALQQAKPLLSASSIKQCEELANSAISSVFGFPYTVEYNIETQRFNLNKGDYITDLAEAEGGGLVTCISFCFDVYLLVKMGKRRFLAYDEAFTQISDKYFPSFIQFIKQMCNDLGVDLLLISHDQRISPEDADTVYVIEDGKSRRVK